MNVPEKLPVVKTAIVQISLLINAMTMQASATSKNSLPQKDRIIFSPG